MKNLIVCFFISFIISYGYAQNSKDASFYISKIDVEKILGQPAKLISNAVEKENNITKYRSKYTGNRSDKAGKMGNLDYLVEEYVSVNAAHQALTYILAQNSNRSGLKMITNLGNEAVMHTDGINFEIIMVRKDNKLLKIKVNKLTSFTAPVQTLQAIAKEIVSKW